MWSWCPILKLVRIPLLLRIILEKLSRLDNPGCYAGWQLTELQSEWGCILRSRSRSLSLPGPLSCSLSLLTTSAVVMLLRRPPVDGREEGEVGRGGERKGKAARQQLQQLRRRLRRRQRRSGESRCARLLLKILRNSRESFSRYQTSESSSRCVLFLSKLKPCK